MKWEVNKKWGENSLNYHTCSHTGLQWGGSLYTVERTHPPGTTNGQAIVFKICVNYKDRGLNNQKYYQHNSKCNEMNMASLWDSN